MSTPDPVGAIQPFPQKGSHSLWYSELTESTQTLTDFLKREDTSYLYNNRGKQQGALPLTPERWETITRINATVNARATYVPDLVDADGKDSDTHQTLEANNWQGDCEDFALQKQKELIAAGFPPESVLLAYTDSEQNLLGKGIDHAVLVVRTDHGDFVLDNDQESSQVLPWTDATSRIVALQSAVAPEVMQRVNHVTGYVQQSKQGSGVSQLYLTQADETNSIYANGRMPSGQSFGIAGMNCTTSRPLFFKLEAIADWSDTRSNEVSLHGTDAEGKPLRTDWYTTRDGLDADHVVTDGAFDTIGHAKSSEERVHTITPVEGVSATTLAAELKPAIDKMRALGIRCDGDMAPSVTKDGQQVIAPVNVSSLATGLLGHVFKTNEEPDAIITHSIVESMTNIPVLPEDLSPKPVSVATTDHSNNVLAGR